MTLTDRDRKIAILLIPVIVVAAYWFLILTPKREEASKLGDQLALVQGERDAAEAVASNAESTRGDYARDYATVVRLGKAIPTDVDLPSLLVQLDRATKGTHIRFAKIAVGARLAAPAAAVPTAVGAAPAAPVEAGGAAASSGSGTAVETANEGAAAAEGAPAPADGAAATPAPGAIGATGSTGAVSPVPALDTVPLTFSFTGSFFDLADFFHQMKRFVRLADGRIRVDGRLMKIDGFTFGSAEFPTITADVTASVYLAPKTEGTTAGGTATGPEGTVGVADASASAPAEGAPAIAPAAEGVVR